MAPTNRKSLKIAVLFDNSRKYDRDVMRGIFQFVAKHPGWSTYLLPPAYVVSTTPERLYKSFINPAGAIVRDYEGWEALKELDIPIVISPFQEIHPDVINLTCDDHKMGKLAALFFKQKGFRNFAYYGNSKHHWSVKRRTAFEDELKDKRFVYHAVPDEFNQIGWSKRFEYLSQWLLNQSFPLAVFCATDEYARLMIEAVNYAQLRCPEDVAILGVDNDDSICDLSSPSISSIDQGGVRAGYLAAKKIVQLYESANSDRNNIVVPPIEVVERQSTAIVATDNPEIQKVISFISENANSTNINVSDVLRVTSMSRRLLEKRFKEQVGTSILAFIQERRNNHIKKLLLETSLSVKEIAAQMDFANFESIGRYFKKATSYTPSEYRRKFKNN